MRTFNYRSEALRLLSFDSASRIGTAYGFIDRHSLAVTHVPDLLQEMKEATFVHDVALGLRNKESVLTKDRVVELIFEHAAPINYDERLAIGYHRALTAINSGELEEKDLFAAAEQLHQLLYSEMPEPMAFWRTTNVPLYRIMKDFMVKHHPFPAQDAPEAFERICQQCQWALADRTINMLYIIPIMVVDVLYVQPFAQNTSTMVRLLIHHLLHNAGIPVMEYVTMEGLIRQDMYGMYDAIEKSFLRWEEEINDYRPAFRYWIELIQKACGVYNCWVSSMTENVIVKQKIIEKYIIVYNGEVTKQMIRDFTIGISDSTIAIALTRLLKEGKIEKLNSGRSTAYRYIEK